MRNLLAGEFWTSRGHNGAKNCQQRDAVYVEGTLCLLLFSILTYMYILWLTCNVSMFKRSEDSLLNTSKIYIYICHNIYHICSWFLNAIFCWPIHSLFTYFSSSDNAAIITHVKVSEVSLVLVIWVIFLIYKILERQMLIVCIERRLWLLIS